MRSFVGDEPFEQVARPRAADASTIAISLWQPKAGRLRGTPLRFMQAGIILAIVLAAVVCYFTDNHPAAIFFGLIALVWVLMSVVNKARQRQERKVAAIMHDSSASALSPDVSAAETGAPRIDGPPRVASSIRLDIYLQSELPALSLPYRAPIGADRNIVGLPPRRILYLCNFFSIESLAQKLKGNWRRFGPVYFLSSPSDISYSHTFDRHIGDSVVPQILSSADAFDARLASAAETVLPPGDKELKDVSLFSGGYAQHLFLCDDHSWRHGVTRLFEHAEVVLLDACDYDAQRSGLNWEIGQLIDQIATTNFVVLVDEDTDQGALCAAFRSAWVKMRGESPNNRPDAGPVRWVVLDPRGELVRPQTPPPGADPFGHYAKLSPLVRPLMASHYGEALINDRIFGLLIAQDKVRSA